MALLWYGGTSSMMFACMKVETKKFYISNANETALNYRKTKTVIAKLKQTDILKLINFKFMHMT